MDTRSRRMWNRAGVLALGMGLMLVLSGCPASGPHVYADLDVSGKGNAAPFLGKGFSIQEPWGRWTDGPQALLILNLDSAPTKEVVLEANVNALLTPKHPDQSVDILLNGKPIGTWKFTMESNGPIRTVTIPAGYIPSKDGVNVTFMIAKPVQPVKLGMGTDTRMIGIGLSKIRIVEAK